MSYRLHEITDLTIPALDMLCRMSETQLLRAEEPRPGYFIAESPRVMVRALRAGYEPVSLLAEKGLAESAAALAAKKEAQRDPLQTRDISMMWTLHYAYILAVHQSMDSAPGTMRVLLWT